MSFVGWARRAFSFGEPLPENNEALKADPDILHIGRRAYCRRELYEGRSHLRKVFTTRRDGRVAFRNELTAHSTFRETKWLQPPVKSGANWLLFPLFNIESRLDLAAPTLTESERVMFAGQALSIILDMLVHGYAHRDFHAQNLFIQNDNLILVDFETMTEYPTDKRVGLSHCYDITGHGLPSPWLTGQMAWTCDHRYSLANVLKVTYADARVELAKTLKNTLREASLSFHTDGSRHTCRQGRIYSSFSVNDLTVLPSEAQRNCRRRFEDFRIDATLLCGKRILDLGSNVGGMLFEAQRFSPGECVGLEYDPSKVGIANAVASFADLTNVTFCQGNIDTTTPRSIRGPYDVVFCLAVEAHVTNPARMYRLLGKLTGHVLLFEGNEGTDTTQAIKALKQAGFSRVDDLGTCDDDSLASNNCRPLLRAYK